MALLPPKDSLPRHPLQQPCSQFGRSPSFRSLAIHRVSGTILRISASVTVNRLRAYSQTPFNAARTAEWYPLAELSHARREEAEGPDVHKCRRQGCGYSEETADGVTYSGVRVQHEAPAGHRYFNDFSAYFSRGERI